MNARSLRRQWRQLVHGLLVVATIHVIAGVTAFMRWPEQTVQLVDRSARLFGLEPGAVRWYSEGPDPGPTPEGAVSTTEIPGDAEFRAMIDRLATRGTLCRGSLSYCEEYKTLPGIVTEEQVFALLHHKSSNVRAYFASRGWQS